jgi:hypothetical protein
MPPGRKWDEERSASSVLPQTLSTDKEQFIGAADRKASHSL